MTPVQIGLLAAAAYLAYQWWKDSQGGNIPPTTTGGAASGGGYEQVHQILIETPEQTAERKAAAKAQEEAAARQAAADAEYLRRQGTEQDPIRQTDDDTIAKMASTGQIATAITESDRRGIRFNHHQWNHYRAAALGTPQPDPELWAPGQTGTAVLASQYIAMRAAAGQSGMGELGRAYPSLMWVT